ncbi:O-antigen ligase family protein [Candidatus Pantoea soli]|uniref:O-antigen ligase family protein n=1 Tax=Candidatus Pantoea soli TaxID=3098669 RepID=A0A518X933_9GAMM|nr:O-antigen ligase family protein [Pantoea soli]QDY40710.1 O-antigen ligase family protein [Pantoea soli]
MKRVVIQPWLAEKNLYACCFLLLTAALAAALVVPAYPKKIFYFVSYVVALFLLVQGIRKRWIADKTALAVALPLLFIGLVRLIWSRLFAHAAFSDVVDNYSQGGKLFIIAALLSYFILSWRACLTRRLLGISAIILFIGLLATLGAGLYEHFRTLQRIQLLTDSAGTVSYLITALALTTLYVSHQVVTQRLGQMALFLAVFALNMALMILTESRAGILTLPLLYLAYFSLTHRWAGKITLAGLAAAVVIGLFLMPASVWQRLDSIHNEVDSYQTNNNTSIGARFSIWKGGWHSVSWSLLGQSPDSRTAIARTYIQQHERNNPEAWKNVMYHLHDDTLETLSLQGIAGLLSLLTFYLTLLVVAIRRGVPGLSLLPLAIVIFGLTDTVLIQSSSVMILALAIILSYALMASPPQRSR